MVFSDSRESSANGRPRAGRAGCASARGRAPTRAGACAVGEAEHLGEVNEAARRSLAAEHDGVALMPVQPGEEDDARLVEPGGCGEDRARQRQGGREDVVEGGDVAAGEAIEQGHRRRGDRV